MPVDFGKECSKYIYLNGARTEVHLSDGSLLYNVEISLPGARGIGIVKKLIKDAKTGEVKYTITQERNREDIYDAPMYFISATRPDETGSIFPAGHGHIGRLYQDGHEICVSFRRKDSLKEKPTLRKEKEDSHEGTTSSENSDDDHTARHSLSSGLSSNSADATDADQKGPARVSEDRAARAAETPPESQEDATVSSRFMNFFSKLFLRDHRKHNRFVALYYDGHGHWTYRASEVSQLTPRAPDAQTKDIVIAHKEVEDTVQKKGFLGLTDFALQPENQHLREMVIAAWLAVLWEEERWAGLPMQLRVKGLEYTGGCAPTPKSHSHHGLGHRRSSSSGSASGMKRHSQEV